MTQPKLIKPPPSNISRDSYSWKDSRKYWEEARIERARQLQLRLAAIPTAKTNRSSFLELPLEIRKQILEYAIEWKDLVCENYRGRSRSKKWQKLSLSKLPFWFAQCPTVLALNRQVLCEAVTVLMRRPLVIAPLRDGQRLVHDWWANATIVWPMARLFTLFEMASWGQKLHMTPRLVIKDPNVLEGHLWAPLREILMIWRERMVYEHLRIEIKQDANNIIPIYSSAPGAWGVIIPEVEVKEFPNILVIRSSQWACMPEMRASEIFGDSNSPLTLRSLEYSLQAPIAMSKCSAGKILRVKVLTGLER